jgi:hypothetical protein
MQIFVTILSNAKKEGTNMTMKIKKDIRPNSAKVKTKNGHRATTSLGDSGVEMRLGAIEKALERVQGQQQAINTALARETEYNVAFGGSTGTEMFGVVNTPGPALRNEWHLVFLP